MSLYKQLWLSIIVLLVLVFSGSFYVSTQSAKAYLEKQLAIKNIDNAAALALSLTQQGADDVLLELTVAAQFDTGFYELIELADPTGKPKYYRVDSQEVTDAPGWFVNLFPIEVDPGVAVVQAGWQQVGTLTVRSHSKFAYRELWQNTQQLALVFLVAMIAAGFIGSQLLKVILRPLDDVVEQAEAIGDRRFITIDEPKTREFKQLVSAMNTLSQRIKQVLGQESQRLQKWQREATIDKVTGLHAREPFMKDLVSALESDDVNATGGLTLIRMGGLAQLNQTYGRKAIDSVLTEIGNALNRITVQHSRWAASRLNGSDFAILAPRALDPREAARDAQGAIREVLEAASMMEGASLPAATTIFVHGDSVGGLMTRLDGALLSSDEQGESEIVIAHAGDVQMKPIRQQMEEWRQIFEQSFRQRHFTLEYFPVIGLSGELIHYESPVRLEWEGKTLSAGHFLPWINRLQISGELDKQVVELALDAIERDGQQVCVNLSVGALVDTGFLMWISERLSAHSEAANKLWMEVPESMAFRHLESFKKLCTHAKANGAKMGIEHVGHQLAELGQLHDVGLDYLKVDPTFVRDIDDNSANQTLLRTLCTVGHSIGVIVIGEGVRTDAEWEALKEVGADGATGPGIKFEG